MPDALLALVVIVLLPVRAWRRHRRGAPPTAPPLYLLEVAALTGWMAARLVANHVTLQAIGARPPSLLRFAADLTICLAAVIGLDVLSLQVALRRRATAMPATDRAGVFGDATAAARRLAWFIPVTIAGAVWEELCFRGVTFLVVPQTVGGLALGVFVGSVAFGSQHLRNGVPGFAYAAFFGVLFSCLYLLTRDLIAVMVAHAAGNLFAALYGAPRLARIRPAPAFWA